MRKSTRYSQLLATLLLAALAFALYLRAKAPPEAARLLPECDAIVYANLKPLRAATHFDKNPVARTPEFQQFIDATGIVPERDLDDAAFALHHMDNPTGPNGPVAYSEVFTGRFNAVRLARYLATIAASRETYAGHDIFTIPVGDKENPRTLRVAQLGRDTIAASNMPTPEHIHAMLDRQRGPTSLFTGSSLLSGLYSEVPALSSAWAIGRIGLPFSEGGFVTLFGLRLPLSENTPFIASLRYLGSVRLRVEEIAPTEADATQTAQAVASALTLLRSVVLNQPGTSTAQDAFMRQMLGSIRIVPSKERVVLTANIPTELLRQLSGSNAQAPSQ